MFTEAQMLDAGIDPTARAETIPLEAYVALARNWGQTPIN
jgi:hypothetical protein